MKERKQLSETTTNKLPCENCRAAPGKPAQYFKAGSLIQLLSHEHLGKECLQICGTLFFFTATAPVWLHTRPQNFSPGRLPPAKRPGPKKTGDSPEKNNFFKKNPENQPIINHNKLTNSYLQNKRIVFEYSNAVNCTSHCAGSYRLL
ncbi:MAG: hypothetical protein J5I98_15575 [Phaeodactylibacter sp.]|nr:hypothetical protein [Phaeodactylibacter sp.]